MRKVIRIGIIVVILAALFFGYTIYKKKTGRPEWRLDAASTGTIREEVTASGALNPSSIVEVGTEVSGKISKLYKDFNDTVTRGELIAKLDTENLESSLEAARSDVNRAQININDAQIDLDVQKGLQRSDLGASNDLLKAQNKYDMAVQSLANSRSALQKAQKNLQNAIITSPIDGVVISRNVEEGQTVAASMSSPVLYVIANNLRKMQISADVDEADIGKIRVGLPVEFNVDAFADEQFDGTVNQVRLSPNTNNNVVTYTVIIDVENPQLKLLPGMTANVTIVVQSKENVMRIPETAIRFKPTKELWQLFGLKWDDSLTRRSGRRGQNGPGDRYNPSGGQSTSVNSNGDRTRTKSGLPDSLKAQLAKMTPEQKKAYFLNRKEQGGNPDFSKLTPEQRKAMRNKSKQGDKTQQTMEESSPGSSQFNFGGNASQVEKTNRSRVWILVDGKPQALDIVTGLSDGTFVQVISGLKADQQFITGVIYKNAKQAKSTSSSAFGPGGGFGQH
jgi:HlyD family secretion protein